MLSFLCDYDHSIVQSLQAGFTFGFPLHSGGPRHSQYASNLLSAIQNPNAVDIKLSQELEARGLQVFLRCHVPRVLESAWCPRRLLASFGSFTIFLTLKVLLLTMASPLITPVLPILPSKMLYDLSNVSAPTAI